MKNHTELSSSLRTSISDISAVGGELSDEQLRLISGGGAQRRTRPSSYTPPGKIDTATDWVPDRRVSGVLR